MAQPSIVDSNVLGFCISIEDGHAAVLFDAVRRLAGVRFSNPADLLGLAMAHEMGHILLRSVNHSAAGIMRAQWIPKDFRDAEAELLVFTREQADSMRAEVRRRLALGWLPPSENISAVSRQSLAQGDLSEAVPRPCLSIRLYNLADVTPQTLDRAAEEATRILTTAAVDIVWQQGPVDSPEARTFDQTGYRKGQHPKPDTRNYLVVCIRHGDPASAFPGSLGFALPDARLGVHATIFYDRIEEVTKLVIITVPKMLGHVMAHEIGHVLLGSTEHSSAGIMKAIWHRNDFQYDPAGRMEFTPEQRSVIRERASVRVLLQPE